MVWHVTIVSNLMFGPEKRGAGIVPVGPPVTVVALSDWPRGGETGRHHPGMHNVRARPSR
jgi:hypothetical protein